MQIQADSSIGFPESVRRLSSLRNIGVRPIWCHCPALPMTARASRTITGCRTLYSDRGRADNCAVLWMLGRSLCNRDNAEGRASVMLGTLSTPDVRRTSIGLPYTPTLRVGGAHQRTEGWR